MSAVLLISACARQRSMVARDGRRSLPSTSETAKLSCCRILTEGVKRALEAANALQDVAQTIRVVVLPGLDGATKNRDVSDWLDRDAGNAERFADIWRAAPPWTPGLEVEGMAAASTVNAKETGIDATSEIHRPVIVVQAGALHQTASEAEAVLINAGTPLYTRGGVIVRPIVELVPAFRKRKTHVTRLKALTVDALRDQMSKAISFRRFDGRARKEVAIDPPHDVAQTMLARDGFWKFPTLTGISTTATLRPDGSILSDEGYDTATGLLLLALPPMPAIKQRPSRDDALAALALLKGLLDEFPFVSDADRSVALSALMTGVARGAMQVAPLHAVTAPAAGTGKSYIIDLASAITTGEIAPVIAAGRDEAETEKRLGAVLMTAQPIISIDNLNGDLGGDFLCQAIERPIINPRVLGRSETLRIENKVTMFVNGNNIRLVGDVGRRTILCSLDADMERPELRRFHSDPALTVLTNRGAYVAAVLTIVRAYITAGYPELCPPLASFDDWSRLVRSPLVWLGCADPVRTMETARSEDPGIINLRAVVAAWLAAVGTDKRLTAGDLREAALSSSISDGTGNLNRALLAVAAPPGRSEVDTRRLGNWLGRHRGRIIDGIKIHSEQDKHSKQMVWWLAEVLPAKTS